MHQTLHQASSKLIEKLGPQPMAPTWLAPANLVVTFHRLMIFPFPLSCLSYAYPHNNDVDELPLTLIPSVDTVIGPFGVLS